uniref:Microtubule actin crosslinking factor 1 n=1 Tax=Xenopus tropicalis TaxID=8364 RepID=A0A6I8S9K7_XENTR
MGKPLSRPDCLRQNPSCLGKGEEEDGYIEDCYVPQRSIYDTMRINEQIDQGCKLSQPSKSTVDQGEIGTLSSNGTLGTSNIYDAKTQEAKKLDERVIFDALKLSSDTLKSAPAPPRRRQNTERKENVNRRSWKAFMPPNFPEFAERIEASLSEVSEAGTSNHSLHDKTEFSQLLPESSKHSFSEHSTSTVEHNRTPMLASVVSGKHSFEHHVDEAFPHIQSFDYYNDNEYEQDPLLMQQNTTTRAKTGHIFPSATWPRALKSFIKGSLSDGHHKTSDFAYEECVIETLPLSPCLSDEVLDESVNVLIVPNLREKTESELRFEEDEQKMLMEAEEWEDIIESEMEKCSIPTKDFKGDLKEVGQIEANGGSPHQSSPVSNLGADLSTTGDVGITDPSLWHVYQESDPEYSCFSAVNVERKPTKRCSKVGSYSDSDTDSDQSFLELEKQCINELEEEMVESQKSCSNTHIITLDFPLVAADCVQSTEYVSDDHTSKCLVFNVIDLPSSQPFSLDNPNTLTVDSANKCSERAVISNRTDKTLQSSIVQQLPTSKKIHDANEHLLKQADQCKATISVSEEVVAISDTAASNIDVSQDPLHLPELPEILLCAQPYQHSSSDNHVGCFSEDTRREEPLEHIPKVDYLTNSQAKQECALEGYIHMVSERTSSPYKESPSRMSDAVSGAYFEITEFPKDSSFQSVDIVKVGTFSELISESESGIEQSSISRTGEYVKLLNISQSTEDSSVMNKQQSCTCVGEFLDNVNCEKSGNLTLGILSADSYQNSMLDLSGDETHVDDSEILSKDIKCNASSTIKLHTESHSSLKETSEMPSNKYGNVNMSVSVEQNPTSIEQPSLLESDNYIGTGLPSEEGQDSNTECSLSAPVNIKEGSPFKEAYLYVQGLKEPQLCSEKQFHQEDTTKQPFPEILGNSDLLSFGTEQSISETNLIGSSSAFSFTSSQDLISPDKTPEEYSVAESIDGSPVSLLQSPTFKCSLHESPQSSTVAYTLSETKPVSSIIPDLNINSKILGKSTEKICESFVTSVLAKDVDFYPVHLDLGQHTPPSCVKDTVTTELSAPKETVGVPACSTWCGDNTENNLASFTQEEISDSTQCTRDIYSSPPCEDDAMTPNSSGHHEQTVFQKEQVDSLQAKLHQVNGIGQGLIQSADKNCDVHGLEHDTEELNIKWNTLNKKVAERVTQLQEALLHCGKFQDALEPLLSWLTDTEDLIANQKPPSAEYKVVKAQIQEQKLLQRLLDDRRTTVEMIQAEGVRIAEGADPADGDKISHQLEILAERWSLLLQKAQSRQKQLEDILVLAKQFHETTEPIFDWLSATEKKLANSEPIGTQTGKIQQQIQRHKSLEGDITVHETDVHQANKLGGSLAALCSNAEQERLSQKLEFLQARYSEVQDLCSRKGTLLGQALINARLFGEDEVEVLNWLGDVEDRLNSVCVKDYKPEVLQNQHKQHMALNEDIINRKKNVDQAIKNGQALLKQTTGEEVLLIQEKLDGIKTRYSEITASSGKALKTLEQALQLAGKFQATHDELTGWLRRAEDELSQSFGQSPSGDMIPQFQQQQKELKKEAMEYRIVLDTINEVGSALLELVPWRAREGLDKLVADANEQYRSISDTIGQRVDQIDAAIQRSQQYEQAADAELAWVAETKRKLLALGSICLEQDQTTAQLQVQKAFSVDIIRHKDSIDELISTEEEILATCGDEQKSVLQEKTKNLVQHYEDISHLNSERYARLERAQVLVGQFWETYEELIPWIDEMQVLFSQLPPPAVDHEMLRQQQEEMRQLRESVAEHKPHIDKLLKIGPHLSELNPEEGTAVQEKYRSAEKLYVGIKEEVRKRAMVLDDALAQAAQIGEFHDKIGPMLETLESMASRLRMPPLIPAEVEKIRECISENKNAVMELEKLQPAFQALKHRGEELISRSQGPDIDPAAKDIQDKLDQLVFFWEDIKARADERESKFLDVLELAEKFWLDMNTLLTTIKDTHEIVHDLESPGIDPSMIKQQIEAADSIKEETDGLHEELEFIRILGADLIFACGETEKPEVKKSIDEMNTAWENLKRTWAERIEKLRDAMSHAVQYQDSLQAMFDWLDNTVIKLCDMPPVGTDISTVKEQIEEMKEFKVEVYQQQIEMEKLNHQGELMLKKAIDDTDRDIIQGPLTELKHLWENLGEKIAHRQQKLEDSLLALGQFQHALAELMSWLTHTNELLNAQRPICGDPKVIEVELAKHHVLKNDVLAHQSTVQIVNKAGNELLESSAGDDASSLRTRLETLNQLWEIVLQKTEEREQQLDMALQQAQGFSGEIEDFIQWQTNIESQLSAAKPTGGLPETAREQLQAHMELFAEIKANEDLYRHLLDKGQLMLISRDDATGSITEQNVSILKRKWQAISNKVEERKAKLEEALTLATDFQNSLQDFINWLTQAEQSLNIAPSPSLILDTVLFQIDEHKVFVNEVNIHREHIIELDKIGNQLKFLSQKQDVVLIKNLLLSVQSRWEKVVQRSVERGRSLDDARKRAKQFHEAWKKLIDWLEEAENHLDSELEISNDPDKIKLQLSKHKEFQKTLGSKQPVYDTTVRTGRALKEKALLSGDVQKLDHLLGEVRDKWDTVCGKSVERQHKLEEALLFSGQFMDALQALVDWLYKVEPQLAEDQPLHGDLDLVMNLMDAHKVFQKELGKRTSSVQALKRSARELLESSREDTTWVKVQLQELSTRWDTVCKLSVSKQTRLEQALKQAEEFHAAVHMLLEWLSEAEQTLRFRGALPDDAESLQSLIDIHKEFMRKVEEKQIDVNTAVSMGEEILTMCHPDCITTIKHWITIIRARFEEVLTWGNQHQQRLQTALSELLANSELLDELLSWIQWAETTLIQRGQDPMPQNIDQVKALISEHQVFMEEMTQKQPDVDRVTKTYKRKTTDTNHASFNDKTRRKHSVQNATPVLPVLSQPETKNPRINQLSARWQQVWLLALERQRKLNDALDRLEELKEFANFDFDIWRKKYMRWMNHKKSRVMDFFRRIDKDQDGKITRQEFIDGILASKFPTTRLEMTAVADIFDRDGDGYIDYYEFVAALHPNKDAYRPTTDADKIEDEVTRQVAQCKCAKRFQVEQIGENKYRFFLGNQFGDSQQLRLVRILRSTVMVRVGGGWMALDEFLVKNDPCRVHHPGNKLKRTDSISSIARGRTNLELREKFILPEGVSQGMTPFRSRGRRSKPSSRTASPTRSSSSASQSNHSCTSVPSSPATPASGSKTPQHLSRCYEKPWLVNSKASTPIRCAEYPDFHTPSPEVTPAQGSKLKKAAVHTSRSSLTGDTPTSSSAKSGRADPKKSASRAGSRAGSRASSRRGSDASDFDLLETQSACSDTSESSAAGGPGSSRRGLSKPSKIPTMSKKTASTPKTQGTKR